MPQTDYAGLATSTTLLGTLLSSAGAGTVVTLVNATGWPTGASGLVFVGTFGRGTSSEEKILFSSRTGNNLTISQRGYDDTVAVTHQNGETVSHTNDATLLRTASAHIFDSTRNDHPQYARVGATNTFTQPQTISGALTLGAAATAVGNVTAQLSTANQLSIGSVTGVGPGIQAGGGSPTNYIALIAANTWGIFTNTAQQAKVDDGGGVGTPAQTALSVRHNATVKRVEVGAVDSGGTGYRLVRIAN